MKNGAWGDKGKLIFFIAQNGRYIYIDCGATSDVFSTHENSMFTLRSLWFFCNEISMQIMATEDDFSWDDDLMTKSLQRQTSHLAKLGKINIFSFLQPATLYEA
jgi:hypothetical protein